VNESDRADHRTEGHRRAGSRRGRAALCVLAVAITALSLAASAALAATGALTGQGCIADVGDAAGCGTTQQGLNGPEAVATSPDGKSVYVASVFDDAIVRFDRNTTTGALTPAGCIADVGDAAGCGTTQQGLNGAYGVAVSPNGKSVYVASNDDDAIVRFDRDTTTGALTPAGCIADVGDGAGCGTTQQGLNAANTLAVSPDGKSVYVAGGTDDAIVRFDRDTTTGALTGQGCTADVGDGAGCGTTQQGLDNTQGVAVSPDGKSVYATGVNDDTIARFDRDTTTGAFTPSGCIADVGDVAGCGTTQQGLDGAVGVVVSPDDKSVYAAGSNDSAVVRFDRNLTTGALTGQGCIADVGDGAGCGTTEEGLGFALWVAVSPDGKSAYVTAFGDSAIARFDRDTTTGALTPAGCIADVGDAAGCGTTQQGLNGPNGAAVSADGKSVYVAAQEDDAIVRFNREPADTTPPNTTITAGPKPTTKKQTATFKFKASEAGSSFQCKLDRHGFKPCQSPKTYRHLKRGRHTFKVRATDSAENVDPTPAKRSWRIR
jgi:DNA-binding beta-propeller fold protein YncE